MGIDDWAATVHYPADGANRQIYQCDAPEDVGFWPGAAIRKYEGKLRSSIFMYRWVSRITLEITDVRVERLQDINNNDARAEGVDACPHRGGTCGFFETGIDQCFGCSYRMLWNQINGPKGKNWEFNPWVWIVEFRRVDGRVQSGVD